MHGQKINENKESGSELPALRQQISGINHQILQLLNQRVDLVEQIRVYKEQHNIDLFLPEREQEMLDTLV
jgi:chorismate mutase